MRALLICGGCASTHAMLVDGLEVWFSAISSYRQNTRKSEPVVICVEANLAVVYLSPCLSPFRKKERRLVFEVENAAEDDQGCDELGMLS